MNSTYQRQDNSSDLTPIEPDIEAAFLPDIKTGTYFGPNGLSTSGLNSPKDVLDEIINDDFLINNDNSTIKQAIQDYILTHVIGANLKLNTTFDDHVYESWDDIFKHGKNVGSNELRDSMRLIVKGEKDE